MPPTLKQLLRTLFYTMEISCVAFVVLIALSFSVARAFLPALNHQRIPLENIVSLLVGHPTQIGTLKIKWHDIDPVIETTGIIVFDKTREQPLLTLNKLDASIDMIASSLSGHIHLNDIYLDGTQLTVQQLADGGYTLNGLWTSQLSANSDSPDEWNKLFRWLSPVSRVSLNNINLHWQSNTGQQLALNDLNLLLQNRGPRHTLAGQTQLAQNTPVQLSFVLQAAGSLRQKAFYKAHFYLHAQNIALGEWLKNYPVDGKIIQQGTANVQLWGFWLPDHLETVRSLFNIQNLELSDTQSATPFILAHCNGNTLWHYHRFSKTWSSDTALMNLSFARWNKIPGITNLNAYLHVEPDTGFIELAKQKVQIDFGPLFRLPISINQLTTHIEWKNHTHYWSVNATDTHLQNQDAIGSGSMGLRIPKNGDSPTLSLLAAVNFNNAQHIGDYLPLTVLKPALVDWLNRAVRSANSIEATTVINGRLADFPFDNNSGTFIVDSEIKNGELDYWPSWPSIQQMDAHLVFAERSMEVLIHSAKTLAIPMKNIHAVIPLLKKDVEAILTVSGDFNSTLQHGILFLRASPLHEGVLETVRNLDAKGPMQLHLQLDIPLEKTATPIKVAGKIITKNATLTIPQWNASLENLQGELNFTRDSVTAPALSAKLWDKPIKIAFISQPKTQIQINYDGLLANATTGAQGAWNVNLQSPTTLGQIIIPANKQQALQANFQRLYLSDQSLNSSKRWTPKDLPRLNFSGADVRYGKKSFGHVQFQLSPTGDGVSITKLQASAPTFTLNANGSWRLVKGRDSSQLNGTLTTTDLGSALVAWGFPAGIQSKNSAIGFALSWPGAIYDPSFKLMNGQLSLNLTNGQISNIGSQASTQMSIGRLLNFFSLKSLIQDLDFNSTKFKSSGFNFDSLKGTFNLTNGNAITQNTELKGEVAQISIAGRIGLSAEDYNLQLTIKPSLGSFDLAGFIAGPVVGFLTLAANWLFVDPALRKITTTTYIMTGPWSNPTIVKAAAPTN